MSKEIALKNFLDHIRSYNVDDIILRKKLVISPIYFGRGQTMDNYRNYLTHAGYLKWMDRGKYQYVKKIPMDMNYSKLINESYPNSEWVKKYKI